MPGLTDSAIICRTPYIDIQGCQCATRVSSPTPSFPGSVPTATPPFEDDTLSLACCGEGVVLRLGTHLIAEKWGSVVACCLLRTRTKDCQAPHRPLPPPSTRLL